MWERYRKCGSYTQVAEIVKRERSTVSKHIAAYKASINAVNALQTAMK